MRTCRAGRKFSIYKKRGDLERCKGRGESLSLSHHPPLIYTRSSLELELVLSRLDSSDGSLAQTSLKPFITCTPTPRPKMNTTVNIIRGQSGVKTLSDIGKPIAWSLSVKGVRSGTLLSPDVHTKDNRLMEKKIRDQTNQSAGNAKKTHRFQ